MKPRKKRDVLYPPGAFYFKPQGIPMPYLSMVNLTIDEYEAIRLGDLDNLTNKIERGTLKFLEDVEGFLSTH